MKKNVLSIIILLIMTNVVLSAEDLNDNSEFIKRVSPGGYELIKVFAVTEWGEDHSMVLYEINNQSNNSEKLIDLFLETADIQLFADAIEEWSYGDYLTNLEIFIAWVKGEKPYGYIYNMTVDWAMVWYEYDRQIKASSPY
jgi:hypothetical protein